MGDPPLLVECRNRFDAKRFPRVALTIVTGRPASTLFNIAVAMSPPWLTSAATQPA
jgi:hypothetical protein